MNLINEKGKRKYHKIEKDKIILETNQVRQTNIKTIKKSTKFEMKEKRN